jgi:hypothetical protein
MPRKERQNKKAKSHNHSFQSLSLRLMPQCSSENKSEANCVNNRIDSEPTPRAGNSISWSSESSEATEIETHQIKFS